MHRYRLKIGLGLAVKLGLLAVVLVAGCASPPKISVEEHLSYQTLQWTDALMSQDYERALTFMTPSYQSGPRAERFKGDFSGTSFWQNAEIKWVKCDQENSPPAGPTDDGAAAASGSASNAAPALDAASDCVVNVWEDCGQELAVPFSTSSTMSTHSGRCEVRVMLSVMKPPEMSFPMPIPYEVTWLNVDGVWYIYRQ
ncbi:hypothetical protein N9T47_02435 [Luminiphilus sp.]|nr:hypothetical protein [Luminiphilus sp.]MDA9667011.1 hypothetical protein [Luminiphilus sp.]